ncbi:MAG: hypothetical protein NPIRA05_01200 [Nitrospirales bacterium]|nr:MAG: hypothetical protein NPIRA05_01200 [Nitrospirales bacterium]
MATSLGKLQRYTLQEFWGEEIGKFSAWLIQSEVLDMIGESLGFELIAAQQSASVNDSERHVMAKNAKNADPVLIQGQLNSLTHVDFGQLIACAAETNASTVVWVASVIPDEFKHAVDWLNAMSHNAVSFYCAELELWKIDNSAPAASFHVVCQPRSLTRQAKDVQGSIEERKAVKSEVPIATKTASPQRKGDWSKKNQETTYPSSQRQSSGSVKEEVAVRENFVYKKSF